MKRILIADSDPTVLEILKITLDKAGYDTMTILSRRMLLNNLPGEFDLILLDTRKSDMDVPLICRHLKSQQSTKNIPIIMVSSVPELELFPEDQGADGLLEKPIKLVELLNIVKKYTR